MPTHTKNDPTPQAVQDCHEHLVWLIPHLDNLPRSRRFTLGERLESGVLEVLENLVEAAYSRNKTPFLNTANRRLEVNRHLWRAAHELQLIGLKPYEQGSRQMDNLGRQIGGWLRSRPTL